ncbi:glycerol-3-phosphate 1-O-acyltransferase PlsY [Acetohalobium arabaticum]|uniref:Glycerol-3-phosphate acyltransferase n=1 Tax=Acetohalobium arabaticum (strain ATCC 49924 / DSM 5501 / Z-7288) TaxID=574087 RepID=D9QPY1_ACEAZ|nr:glycerol-3-phosphate 1-O-acyltransferase PlsY [Acetohalobium arabaticum]ADL12572.1 acyl-phosphate glycerol-3-phosphate acyltransferase [Acetohalobium arabaticum DSM 5501]
MVSYIFVILISYLLGSIPFGLIITRLVKGVDIREYGSGNIGATNAYRVMGFGMGIMVALCDIGKGYISVFIAQQVFGSQAALILILAGLAAIAGHNWPIFLKFDGGRGVATSVGVLISLLPKAVLIAFFAWLVIVLTTRYVSLGSIIGAVLIPISALIFNSPATYVGLGLAIAIFVVYRHRPNIQRLLAGEENKIGWNMDVEKKEE